jgi:hypothetical protein
MDANKFKLDARVPAFRPFATCDGERTEPRSTFESVTMHAGSGSPVRRPGSEGVSNWSSVAPLDPRVFVVHSQSILRQSKLRESGELISFGKIEAGYVHHRIKPYIGVLIDDKDGQIFFEMNPPFRIERIHFDRKELAPAWVLQKLKEAGIIDYALHPLQYAVACNQLLEPQQAAQGLEGTWLRFRGNIIARYVPGPPSPSIEICFTDDEDRPVPAKTVWIDISAEGRYRSIQHEAQPLSAETVRELLDAEIVTPDLAGDLTERSVRQSTFTLPPPLPPPPPKTQKSEERADNAKRTPSQDMTVLHFLRQQPREAV